jgi:hypothetical protein
LRIANRPIITLYGPISGYSAHDRVDSSRRRIHEVLDNAAHPVVTTTAVPDGTPSRSRAARLPRHGHRRASRGRRGRR